MQNYQKHGRRHCARWPSAYGSANLRAVLAARYYAVLPEEKKMLAANLLGCYVTVGNLQSV